MIDLFYFFIFESEIVRLNYEAKQSITSDYWRRKVSYVKRIEKEYCVNFSFIINIADNSGDDTESSETSDSRKPDLDDDNISDIEHLCI